MPALSSSLPSSYQVAIIGAGMAGVACARRLQDRGFAVTLFEKSRGAGGRAATRVTEDTSFDHGAQFATAHGDDFRRWLDRLIDDGGAAPWAPQGLAAGRRFVGMPGMSNLVKSQAIGLAIHPHVTITGIAGGPGLWMLQGESGPYGPFTHVVVTAPAPQAASLLESTAPTVADRLRLVTYAPCLTAMARFDQPLALPDVLEGETICWASRNNAKPGRRHEPESWVIQANDMISRCYVEEPPEKFGALLLDFFRDEFGYDAPTPTLLVGHRWRYARVTAALDEPFLVSADGTLFAAGDGCLGPRLERAYDSGVAVAAALLDSSGRGRQ